MPFSWTTRKVILLIASYLFYAAWNPPFIILLWISTVVDWWAANRIAYASNPWRRRAWMMVSVTANLGMLGWFKYGEFFLHNFQVLAASVGVQYQPPELDIVLPVGISFYTFATMSYTLDVYLRRSQPTRFGARFQPVRDVLPAPGRRPDHAPDRARAAVPGAAPPDAATSCASGLR